MRKIVPQDPLAPTRPDEGYPGHRDAELNVRLNQPKGWKLSFHSAPGADIGVLSEADLGRRSGLPACPIRLPAGADAVAWAAA